MSRKRKFNELLVVATTALAVSAAVLDRGSPAVPKNTSILTGKAYVRVSCSKQIMKRMKDIKLCFQTLQFALQLIFPPSSRIELEFSSILAF
jgi:hypothetical protein